MTRGQVLLRATRRRRSAVFLNNRFISHWGEKYTVGEAKLFTLPDQAPSI